MVAVKWDLISGYVEQVFNTNGNITRADVYTLAEMNNASDDILDALDAIGSRAFTSPSAVRSYLTAQGYIA
jgi:hypothetical protein